MRIKFKAGDPRAGTIAQMDSIRGQQLIDAGAAVKVKDDGTEDAPAPETVAATGLESGSGDADGHTATTARKSAAKTTAKAKK